MEENTRALDIVCHHFREEYASEDLRKTRNALRRAHNRNSKVRAQNTRLWMELWSARKHVLNAEEELILTRYLLMEFVP